MVSISIQTQPYSPLSETPQAILSLTRRLHLSMNEGKDWAIEAADAERIHEFCQFYQTDPLSLEEKFALMALLVASLDDYLNNTLPVECDPNLSLTVEMLLRRDFSLHRATIVQWCHFDVVSETGPYPEDDETEWDESWGSSPVENAENDETGWVFHVTPMARRVWQEFSALQNAPTPLQ